MRATALALALLAASCGTGRPGALPRDCRQVLAVVAAGRHSTRALACCLERDVLGRWRSVASFPVTLGARGLAPGAGLHPAGLAGAPKREGDLATPAGIFRITRSMGSAPAPPAPSRLPYETITAHHRGVDDPASPHYNRIVDRRTLGPGAAAWRSSEEMLRPDGQYRWLLVLGHNEDRVPGRGSLVFVHVWLSSGTPTAGCVAADESSLLRLLAWLDPGRDPVAVILTDDDYRRRGDAWGLPPLPASCRGIE